jgi:heptosyltransferase III
LLKDAFPEASIDLLVNRKTGEFLEKDPRIRRVLYSDAYDVDTNLRVKGSSYVKQIFRKYDLAINMASSDRGNIAVLLAGRHHRVGFFEEGKFVKHFWKKPFFTHALKLPPRLHIALFSKIIAESLGLEVQKLEAKIYWDQEDERIVGEVLIKKEVLLVPSQFFVVHPFARKQYKYWKAESFAEVSDAIVERYGLTPVWTSSPAETEKEMLLSAVQKCRHRPAIIAGELSLNQMTFLLSQASIYLGLDTAITHLAASQSVPMVVLYGPTIAERWSPWCNDGPLAQQCPRPCGTQRIGQTILIQSSRECIPCDQSGCGDDNGQSLCLSEISTKDVLTEVEQLLSSIYGKK